jgi:hypothetical protein
MSHDIQTITLYELFYVLARVVKDVLDLTASNTPPLTLFFFTVPSFKKHSYSFKTRLALSLLYYSFISMSMNVFIGISPEVIPRTASSTDGSRYQQRAN